MLLVLFEIETKLRQEYNSPHYGNMDNPMEELIYILLSKRTNLRCQQVTYTNLKKEFPQWEMILDSSIDHIQKIIDGGGLVQEKATNIKGLCEKIKNDFGDFDLKKFFLDRNWGDEDIFRYLISLPGIGPKSAYCVMLYSFKLPVMPSDAHVIRVFYRLGLIPYKEEQHHQAQIAISELVKGLPWSMLYSLHVNLKCHGEKICKKNKCCRDKCVISNVCLY